MIVREFEVKKQSEGIFVMSDAVILAASIKSALLEIAKQAAALGNGLQNAAPGDRAATGPNNSVSYLLSTSENILKIAKECGSFQSTSAE